MIWAAPTACVLAWLGGSHLLAVFAALVVYALVLVGSRRTRIAAAIVAPVVLFGFSFVASLGQVQAVPLLFAAVVAWVPLFAQLGGRVPLAIWTYPVVLGITALAMVGPWGLALVASDIATRAQVLVMGAVALVVHAVVTRD